MTLRERRRENTRTEIREKQGVFFLFFFTLNCKRAGKHRASAGTQRRWETHQQHCHPRFLAGWRMQARAGQSLERFQKGWISIAQSEQEKKILKKNQPLATVSHWCDKCARRRGGCGGSTVSDSSQKEKPFPETQRDFFFLFFLFLTIKA